MSDPVEPAPAAATAPAPESHAGAKPSGTATAVREAVDQLRGVLPALTDKNVAQTVETVLKRAADPVRANEREFPHVVAYAVQDVERTGKTLNLTPETRAVMEARAQSAVGLVNTQLIDLLSGTRILSDRALIRDIRRTAAEVGQQTDQDTPDIRERLDVLQNRTRLAETVSARSAPVAEPEKSPAGEARLDNGAPRTTARDDRLQSQPGPTPAGGLVAAPSVGQAIVSQMLRGFQSLGSATTQPWEPAPTAFKERLNSFEGRLQRDRDAETLRGLERSGQVALDSLRGFATGEGAVMLNRIREAGQTEPGGMAAVLSEMRSGGKFAELRKQFNNALNDEKGFTAAYEKAASALTAYGETRIAAADVIARQPGNIAAKYESMDRDIGAAADGVPSRRDGRTMLQDTGREFVEVVHRALQGLKNMFGSSADARASSSPSPA